MRAMRTLLAAVLGMAAFVVFVLAAVPAIIGGAVFLALLVAAESVRPRQDPKRPSKTARFWRAFVDSYVRARAEAKAQRCASRTAHRGPANGKAGNAKRDPCDWMPGTAVTSYPPWPAREDAP